ncbi:hypothetical protein C8A00DRAFT_19322, partial [Chaetomidium leptoderma]
MENATQVPRGKSALRKTAPKGTPRRSEGKQVTFLDPEHGGVTEIPPVSRSGKRHINETTAHQEVALVSVDEKGHLEFQDWVADFEVAAVTAGHDKFSYYEGTQQLKGTIPDDYQGHPAFEAKHMAGLPDHGP